MPHAQSTADAEPQPPSPPGTQMRMGRFVLLFAVCLAVLFGLMLAPLTVPAVAGFTHALVTVAAVLIRLFGGHAVAAGDDARIGGEHAIDVGPDLNLFRMDARADNGR